MYAAKSWLVPLNLTPKFSDLNQVFLEVDHQNKPGKPGTSQNHLMHLLASAITGTKGLNTNKRIESKR